MAQARPKEAGRKREGAVGRALPEPLDDFLREGAVGGGPEAVGLVFENRFAVAWGFAEANGAGNDGVEEVIGEVALDFCDDLSGQIVAHVHGHQDATDAQVGVGATLIDLSDNVVDFGKAFECKVFALNGNK